MKHKICIILTIFILLSTQTNLYSQLFDRDSTRYSIEVQYHYGITIPHHKNMLYLIDDYTKGAEILFIKRRLKSNAWENYFNQPETGIGFWYSSFGRDDIYGKGYSIYPYINFNTYENQRFSLRFKVALGLGYATKPFNKNDNIYNSILGSHLNAYIGLGLKARYELTNNLSLSSSILLNHLSNGSSKKPNNGVNTIAIATGLLYNINYEETDNKTLITPSKSTDREILTTLSIGRNQPTLYSSKKYWSGTFAMTHLWHTTKIKAYGAGVELIRFGGAPYAWRRYYDILTDVTYSNKDFMLLGSFATMESYLGNITLFFSLGTYLYYHTKPIQPIYGRVGVRYKIYDNLIANFGIKANFFAAEFIEFGLGYRWKYKK